MGNHDERVFTTTRDGVLEIKMIEKDGKKFEVSQKVANSDIRVMARIRDGETGNLSMKLQWTREDGETEDACYKLSELWSSKSDINERLADRAGGTFFKSSDFRAFIHACASDAREGKLPTLSGTSLAGWGRDYKCYSANGISFPPETAPTFLNVYGAKWQTSGDETKYLYAMNQILRKNPAVLFLCGFFAAGSIVKLVGAENFILSLVGKSSLGKTLAIKTALAMRGRPGDFSTFDSTAGSLKAELKQSADSCLTIDEIGQSEMRPEQKMKLVYDISQGKERGRLKKDGRDFYIDAMAEKLCYTVIMTGEVGIRGGSAQTTGADVRVTELIFSPENRVWETIGENSEAEEWERFLIDNHGWIMPRVIEFISNNQAEVKDYYIQSLDSLRKFAHSLGATGDNAAARKLKMNALALTGVMVLGDIFGLDFLDEGVSNIEKYVAGLMENSTSSTVISEDDKYRDFLFSLPIRYADRLYGSSASDVKRVVGEVVRTGDRLQMKIIVSEFLALTAADKIDAERLIAWSVNSGMLRYNKNGGGKKVMVKRLKIGDQQVGCYDFMLDNNQNDDDDDGIPF